MLAKLSLDEYAARLASKDPAPGGGSAAALSGLLGTGLLEMAINLTAGRDDFAAQADFLAGKQSALAKLHSELERLIDLDAAAFSAVIDAYRLPKSSEDEKTARLAAIQAALTQAARVPLSTARLCLEALEIGKALLGRINPHAASDLVVGSLACHSGAVGALLNTAINLPLIKDPALAGELKEELRSVRTAADRLIAAIETAAYSEEPFTVMAESRG